MPSPPPAPALSTPKATLHAQTLAAAAELPQLRSLVSEHPTIFSGDILLRVLLCLPETADPASYKQFVDHVLTRTPVSSTAESGVSTIDTSAVAKLSEKQARRRVQQTLPVLNTDPAASKEDHVAAFLIARAFRIDAETGVLSVASELLQPYLHLQPVTHFYNGTLQVLQKVVYEFAREPTPTLQQFHGMPVEEALEVMIVDPDTVVRDLKQLVEPYLSARGDQDWKFVWQRLSTLPFLKIVEFVRSWTPPAAVKTQFSIWALSLCYRCTETQGKVWDGMHTVHRRIAALLGKELGNMELPEKLGDLGNPENPLFKPAESTLGFLDVIITSATILTRPVSEAAQLRLEGTKEIQLAVLKQYVRSGDWNKRSDDDWRKIRTEARWLRNKSQVLSKLSEEELEEVLLAGMLAATRFGLVKDIYVLNSGLSIPAVETAVLEAFSHFFDSASNGNRTRGNMKNAFQCIQVLYPQHSTSSALERAYRLVSAAHSLSNYSLTLTPGVPLLPVQIRIHHDPISLLSRLLDSNRKAYLQPDSLTSIAQDLALGTSKDSSTSSDLEADVEARVLGMATEAALTEEDFETAYAYITTRLLPSAAPPPAPTQTPVQRRVSGQLPPPPQANEAAKDTLWRTALLAGRYQSQYATLAPSAPKGPLALRQLEKKMELLALAIRFAPVEAVAEVLAQWQKCDDEVDALLDAEQRAEEQHAQLAGAGGRDVQARNGENDGPQSLFEVARGAARVFGGRGAGAAVTEEGEKGAAHGRKRDLVAGAVTQGLASGLGWVLGAQPKT